MKTTIFSINQLFEILLDNDYYLMRVCPPLFIPLSKDASYMLLHCKGFGAAVAKRDSKKTWSLMEKAETILPSASMDEVIDFVSRKRLKGTDAVLQSWQDSKSFVEHLNNTYENIIQELCNDNEANSQNTDFRSCLWDFYYLLIGCLRMELPPIQILEENVREKLSSLTDYFFDELIPQCQNGLNEKDESQVHYRMLSRFYELFDTAANLYLT